MRHCDLTKINNCIGKVFLDNRDDLLNKSKSVEDIKNKVNKLFIDNKINTPKSRQILFKLQTISFTQALLYIQNIIFSAANMKVFS
jgi:hypothetical protein